MKRILNKILCLMWGHQFDENYQLTALVKFFTLSYFGEHQVVVKVCEHCEEHKHD